MPSEIQERHWICPNCGTRNVDAPELTAMPWCEECDTTVTWEEIVEEGMEVDWQLQADIAEASDDELGMKGMYLTTETKVVDGITMTTKAKWVEGDSLK